eukprot:4448873-Amphidinium_carterae.1
MLVVALRRIAKWIWPILQGRPGSNSSLDMCCLSATNAQVANTAMHPSSCRMKYRPSVPPNELLGENTKWPHLNTAMCKRQANTPQPETS